MARESMVFRSGDLRVEVSAAVEARWVDVDSAAPDVYSALRGSRFRPVEALGFWPSESFERTRELFVLDLAITAPREVTDILFSTQDGVLGWCTIDRAAEFPLAQLRRAFGRRAASTSAGRGLLLIAHFLSLTENVSRERQRGLVEGFFVPVGRGTFERESVSDQFLSGVSQESAVRRDDPPDTAETTSTERFLQTKTFLQEASGFAAAVHGFQAEAPARISVRIGYPDPAWSSTEGPFPLAELPAGDYWDLTVWLTEPEHLPEPLKASIRLPREGDSSEANFDFTLGKHPRFEARISVLFQGRVLQSARLLADVHATADFPDHAGPPVLQDVVCVFSNLDGRRASDLAIVQNHTAAGQARSTFLSENRAWVADTTLALDAAKEINRLLSDVADWQSDFKRGLRCSKGGELLRKLAQLGSSIAADLFHGNLDRETNRRDIAANEFIQVISTKKNDVIPFEFVYDYRQPNETATVCEHWQKALEDGHCPTPCNDRSRHHVCPMGFWGIRKVIERHQLSREHGTTHNVPVFLQTEPSVNRPTLYLGGTVVLGGSKVVEAQLPGLIDHLTRLNVGVAPANDWEEWQKQVQQHRPNFLLALPHTGGAGLHTTLEIGGFSPKGVLLVCEEDVRSPDKLPGPIVALLGCDVATTADGYSYFVHAFMQRGAVVVIATIATVYGQHAAAVAGALIDRLYRGDSDSCVRLGEAIRALKREALCNDLLMALCLVAFGDADWLFSRLEESS